MELLHAIKEFMLTAILTGIAITIWMSIFVAIAIFFTKPKN